MADPKTTKTEIAIVQSFRKALYYLAPAVRVVAIPNAGKRGLTAIRQAKREGLATGFPDVIVLWAGAGIAFIEFKRPGGVVSDNQGEWHQRLDDLGHRVCVAYGAGQAIKFLISCGAPIDLTETGEETYLGIKLGGAA